MRGLLCLAAPHLERIRNDMRGRWEQMWRETPAGRGKVAGWTRNIGIRTVDELCLKSERPAQLQVQVHQSGSEGDGTGDGHICKAPDRDTSFLLQTHRKYVRE